MKYVFAVGTALVGFACSATSQGTLTPAESAETGESAAEEDASAPGATSSTCESRCTDQLVACGYTERESRQWCVDTCSVATAAQIACLEKAGCSDTAAEACFVTPTPDAGAKVDSGSVDASKPDSGAGNPNATEKGIGASCICSKESTTTDYYKGCSTNLGALRADGQGCGTLELYCIANAKTGYGTCQDTCSKDADCTGGRKCYESSYKGLTQNWKLCQ